MENATKALLIAGGVLIAILIITVMVMLFNSTGNVSRSYNDRIETEEVTKFNSNFTQYLGQKFTIHEAITITNFAKNNGVEIDNGKTTAEIDPATAKEKKYTLTVNSYDENGYIDSITISP